MSRSARSAIRSGCSGIRYISAKPSVPGACPKTCPYHSSRSNLTPFQRVLFPITIMSGGLYWYGERNSERLEREHEKDVWNRALKKHMEEKGVNREVCEATIARMKQKTEAGLTSEAHSFVQRMYEDWLEVLTRDST